MKELRELIRDLREDHDLRQKEVAAYLHISQQIYSNYERGRRVIPVWVVRSLAKYYRISTDYLLGVEIYYPGNIDLGRPYLGNITLRDVMYDIQKLRTESRKELVRYLSYLKAVSRQEEEGKSRQTVKKRKPKEK